LKTIQLPSESDWIAQAKKGDPIAFRHLVQTHQFAVRRTVLGMMGDLDEVDDIAQEVFIRFYKGLSKYRAEAKLSTYLHRIAINLCLDALKRNRRKLQQQSELKEDGVWQLNAENPGKQSDLRDLLTKALQRLEPDFRTVVVLRLVQGYSIKECAQLLKIPEGTVASRLTRGQQKLRVWLNENA